MWRYQSEMDERAVAIEHRAGHLAYLVVSFLLVGDMALHAWRPDLLDWNGMPADVVGILFIGGLTHWVTVVRARTVGPRRVAALVGAAVAALALSAGLALLLLRT